MPFPPTGVVTPSGEYLAMLPDDTLKTTKSEQQSVSGTTASVRGASRRASRGHPSRTSRGSSDTFRSEESWSSFSSMWDSRESRDSGCSETSVAGRSKLSWLRCRNKQRAVGLAAIYAILMIFALPRVLLLQRDPPHKARVAADAGMHGAGGERGHHGELLRAPGAEHAAVGAHYLQNMSVGAASAAVARVAIVADASRLEAATRVAEAEAKARAAEEAPKLEKLALERVRRVVEKERRRSERQANLTRLVKQRQVQRAANKNLMRHKRQQRAGQQSNVTQG